MNNEELINILKALPAVHLRLLDYAQLITSEDGEPDMEKVIFYAREMTDATQEAEAYAKATRKAVECLKVLGHSQS